MLNKKRELTAEDFWNSQLSMKSIPNTMTEFYELERKEQVYVSVHGEAHDENAFLEACKPLMKYLCENYHPHVTVIINGTRAELVEGLKTAKCEDYIKD